MYYSAIWWRVLPLLTIWSLWTATEAQDLPPASYPTQVGSQCFHVRGVPTLRLQCPHGQLVQIRQAFYGAPPSNQSCRYHSQENHCIQLTDMMENCMGRYLCSVTVSNPFLANCLTYANYMQINYTCVPKPDIQDICQTTSAAIYRGYLQSPNYPNANYPPHRHCACRLETNDPSILLQFLDFSVNHTKIGECDGDYLHISHWGRKCGYIAPQRLPETLEITQQHVTLEFWSDDKHQARGFWLEFNGSSGGKVSMTCGPVSDTLGHQNEMSNEIQQYQSHDLSPDPTSHQHGDRQKVLEVDPGLDLESETDEPDRSQDVDEYILVDDPETPDYYPEYDTDGSRYWSSNKIEPPPHWEPSEEDRQLTTDDRQQPSELDPHSENPDRELPPWVVYPRDTMEPSPSTVTKETELSKDSQQNEALNKEDITWDNHDDHNNNHFPQKIDEVQIITGCVVGVLILIAVIIIVVLVFRR